MKQIVEIASLDPAAFKDLLDNAPPKKDMDVEDHMSCTSEGGESVRRESHGNPAGADEVPGCTHVTRGRSRLHDTERGARRAASANSRSPIVGRTSSPASKR